MRTLCAKLKIDFQNASPKLLVATEDRSYRSARVYGTSAVIKTALRTSRSCCPEGLLITASLTTKVLEEPPSRLIASVAPSSIRILASS